MSFDIHHMHARLGVRLGQHPQLASVSAETAALVAERTLVIVLDGADSPLLIADRLSEDVKLASLSPLIVATILPPVIECIAGAIADAQETVDG